MGWLIVALAVIDGAALIVGLTILRRVTRLVHSTAAAIEVAVAAAIDQAKRDAVDSFTAAVGPAITTAAAAALPELSRLAAEALARLHVPADAVVLGWYHVCSNVAGHTWQTEGREFVPEWCPHCGADDMGERYAQRFSRPV